MTGSYELTVHIASSPKSYPSASEGEILARGLRVIAGNLAHREKLYQTLIGELFDYGEQYGYWSLRVRPGYDDRI